MKGGEGGDGFGKEERGKKRKQRVERVIDYIL